MHAGKPQNQSLAIAYAMKKRAEKKKMAEGGMVEEEEASGYEPMPTSDDTMSSEESDEGSESDDMISRIMKMYSKGGEVANDTSMMSDLEDNQFDDLVKDDGEESSYVDDGSGDKQEDEDRHDIVGRIMRSRSKKDRMPRPA